MIPRTTAWLLLGMALLFLGLVRVPAAVFNIANGDVVSLKAAILGSGGNNQADTIILATNGTYVLTTVDNTTDGPSGLPVIGNDQGHALVIAGNGSTIRRDSAAPAFRIFTIAGPTQIDRLTISNGSNGSGNYGGGVYNLDPSLTLTNCTLSGNFATFGGALATNHNAVHLSSCTLVGNSAQDGGGVYNNEGTVELKNCTLTGNTASSLGAAILSFAGLSGNAYLYLTSCTLNNNGIFLDGADATTFIDLGNCILNQSSVAYQLSGNGIVSIFDLGYNLSSGPGNIFLYQATDQVNIDPLLDPLGLQDNGGLTPTQTIALTYGSPAIDKGNSFGLTTDQRGSSRPYDNPSVPNASAGDGSDIGAYEVAQDEDPVQGGTGFVVTTTDDHDDGTCGGADCSLREAIARANQLPGANTIIFAHGLTGAITLTMGELVVTDSLTITGIPIGTISGNGASRVFNFTGGSSSLNGLTIRDGRKQVIIGNPTNGGGIYNSATLHLYGCSLINNRVLGTDTLSPSSASGGAGQGGGIYNSGTLFLEASAFIQTNEASGGTGGNGNFGHGGVASGSGGAGRGGAIFNDTGGSLIVTNSTFSQNMAIGGNGGSGGPFGGNGGNGNGGAIFNLGTMTITSATIDGNSGASGTPGTGTSNGVPGLGSGGVAVGGGTATVTNTIVAGNLGSNGGGNDVDGVFTSQGFNLIGTANHSAGFTASGDQTGTDVSPLDPHLAPLQNGVMLLLRNSSALDRGKSSGLTTDQRGSPRPVDTIFANATGGDGADIGAVEMNLYGGFDTDGDGMSDEFENFYGFNPNDPTDANGDLDGDGLTNLQEFQAGTNPRDPASGLRIIAVARNGNDFVVTFATAVTGKSYRLERKDVLTSPPWVSITGVVDLTATSVGSGQITDTGGASVSKHFYHIRVLP